MYGFEPHVQACQRLNNNNHDFNEAQFFPYAISDKNEERSFYITEFDECCSLLKANHEWLNRFKYRNFFNIKKEIKIKTNNLDNITDLENIDIDAIKCDSQGMELPILKNAQRALSQAFYVEIETGMQQNYIGETTIDDIVPFMRENNFIAMEHFTQPPQPRNNVAANFNGKIGQPMACETIWLKDYISIHKKTKLNLTKEKAMKALLICAKMHYYDYGLELAYFFRDIGLVSSKITNSLEIEENWKIDSPSPSPPKFLSAIATLIRLLPTPARRELGKLIYKESTKQFLLR